MNRIRKVGNLYQVLITPYIKESPDSSLMIGNWTDDKLRNYNVLTFETLNEAQCEAFQHPDIDWHKIIINHEHIFYRLRNTIKAVLDESLFNVEFKSYLMSSDKLKNAMFDRVLNGGTRFNLRYNVSDIISFTITNPWSSVLSEVSLLLEKYKGHLYLDELRIREKKVVDGKIIILYGYTEYGTVYQIKLIPNLMDQWASWVNTYKPTTENAEKNYKQLLNTQNIIDNSTILR
jgi:hypothetical protein